MTSAERAATMIRLTKKGDFAGLSRDHDDGVTILKDGHPFGSVEYVLSFASTDEAACEMLQAEFAAQLELHARAAVAAERRRIAKMMSTRIDAIHSLPRTKSTAKTDDRAIEELSTMALKVLKGRAR
jgi:hypothetical protein